MSTATFVIGLALGVWLVMKWGFRKLPREQWQFLATIPISKDEEGRWRGVNLTYYGFISALSATFAATLFLILIGAHGITVWPSLALLLMVLVVAVPSAKLVARIVEGCRHTFTIGGASFVGLLVSPLAVWLCSILCEGFDGSPAMILVLAAASISFLFGEGLGRLACLSFGCCYGRRVDQLHPWIQALFSRSSIQFWGKTKKISYASGWEGVDVVPIQKITSTIYLALGLVGTALLLEGQISLAFTLTLVLSQLWRLLSETLRADFRGFGRLSKYQWMSVMAIFYGLGIYYYFEDMKHGVGRLDLAISQLWEPSIVLVLQSCFLSIFAMMGWSTVTQSSLTFYVTEMRSKESVDLD